MEIFTSYFAIQKDLPQSMIPISICGRAPFWYKGLEYKKLAPKYKFFMEWKENHDNDFYIEHFKDEVLGVLSAKDVVNELYTLAIKDCAREPNIALLCFEKPDDFCHRHFVAEWLTAAGYPCKEYVLEDNNPFGSFRFANGNTIQAFNVNAGPFERTQRAAVGDVTNDDWLW